MAFINLTPHSVHVYSESSFQGLEQVNPTTWIADAVKGEPLLVANSQGVARISVQTTEVDPVDGIPMVETEYGDAFGIPESVNSDDVFIVSLPMQSMAKASGHPLASQMVSPYKVVRSRQNGSLVLGCMGFTK